MSLAAAAPAAAAAAAAAATTGAAIALDRCDSAAIAVTSSSANAFLFLGGGEKVVRREVLFGTVVTIDKGVKRGRLRLIGDGKDKKLLARDVGTNNFCRATRVSTSNRQTGVSLASACRSAPSTRFWRACNNAQTLYVI